MKDGPNIVGIASLIGDHARASMLLALMSGEALTATELSAEAGISKQTASSHLGKLLESGLLKREIQGRHRYFTLSDADVAVMLERMLGVADRTGAKRWVPGPREPALRKARVCYDHLAGTMGVQAYDALLAAGHLHCEYNRKTEREQVQLSESGVAFFDNLGIDWQPPASSRRPVCRACLDWSSRRHHLAGSAGVALLQYCFSKKWAKRVDGTRVVRFTTRGEQSFDQLFAL
ncbi:MAG: winged helix-turn-helix domain-containing protein [Granulosicoccus sp.]|nr:winged helix-turn-helix domain-containing protein [Granulosicoccus sp.]